MGISLYMIENDSFQRKMCCTMVNKKVKTCLQGRANLNSNIVMLTKSHEHCLIHKSQSFDHLKLIFLKNVKCTMFSQDHRT